MVCLKKVILNSLRKRKVFSKMIINFILNPFNVVQFYIIR